MATHELKIWPAFFEDVVSGKKKFEVRFNDRNFKAGDIIRLAEWDPKSSTFTGSYCICTITYVTTAANWQMIPFHLAIFGFELHEISRLRAGVRVSEALP